MYAIEFDVISHQHAICLPDGVPDGVSLRVLLLSHIPIAKPVDRNLKTLLASIVEGMTEVDTARSRDLGREVPEWAS